jgi:hypothetical protein
VVAEYRQGAAEGLSGIVALLEVEDILETFVPNPFDFVCLVRNLRDVMRQVTGRDTLVAALLFAALLQVDHHTEALSGPWRACLLLGITTAESMYQRACSDRNNRTCRYTQEVFSRKFHRLPPASAADIAIVPAGGDVWHFQQDGADIPA